MRLKQDKEKKDEESLTAELSKVDQEVRCRWYRVAAAMRV